MTEKKWDELTEDEWYTRCAAMGGYSPYRNGNKEKKEEVKSEEPQKNVTSNKTKNWDELTEEEWHIRCAAMGGYSPYRNGR